MFEFKLNEKILYPWMGISKKDTNIVITTKKIGSRFFEEITKTDINSKFNAIDIRFEDAHSFHADFDKTLHIKGKHVSDVGSKNTLSISEFFTNFNVESFEQFFSIDYFKNNKIFIIVRNPYIRFYTGFFEKVDSMAVGEYTSQYLKTESQDSIDSILNKYVNNVDYKYLSDEHMSLWNTFMYGFLINYKLENYVNVIDLGDSEKMNSTFGYLEQPTNRPYLDLWLTNPDNKQHIDTLHENLGYYFDLEMKYYNKLLNLNK